mmetsp:Transcript_14159/g.47242  ORF Transcript_14159/g.47242 Transcript_14159/m.47242 type:complete len:204 (+) Transcript_14159:565-1176(+)
MQRESTWRARMRRGCSASGAWRASVQTRAKPSRRSRRSLSSPTTLRRRRAPRPTSPPFCARPATRAAQTAPRGSSGPPTPGSPPPSESWCASTAPPRTARSARPSRASSRPSTTSGTCRWRRRCWQRATTAARQTTTPRRRRACRGPKRRWRSGARTCAKSTCGCAGRRRSYARRGKRRWPRGLARRPARAAWRACPATRREE